MACRNLHWKVNRRRDLVVVLDGLGGISGAVYRLSARKLVEVVDALSITETALRSSQAKRVSGRRLTFSRWDSRGCLPTGC